MNRRQPPAFGLSFILHVAALAIAVWATARPTHWAFAPGDASGVTKVSVHDAPSSAAPPSADDPRDEPIIDRESHSTLIIQGFTFDFSKVAAREKELFPFLSLRLPLAPPRTVEQRRASVPLRWFSPFASAAPGDPNPPLVLSEGAQQTVVDSAWSRRYRWRVFRPVRDLALKYNADVGGLPALLRR